MIFVLSMDIRYANEGTNLHDRMMELNSTIFKG